MKKFLTSFAVAALCSVAVNAQDSTSNTAGTRNAQQVDYKMQADNGKVTKKEQRQERYNNASPEQKAKMDQHRAVMEKLSPEQKKAVKAEMERHRAAMKQITGVDLPTPPMPPEGGQR